MATIHSLAPEILIDIFELAHDPRKPSTMCAASLVCRAWRDPAQRTLFLDIALPITNTTGPGANTSQRYEEYRATRLHLPRRVELFGPQMNLHTAGPVLRLISGVRQFVIDKVFLGIDFLHAPELQELERLEIVIAFWYYPSKLLPFFSNVRDLNRITVEFHTGAIPTDRGTWTQLAALAGSLPTSITRLGVANVSGASNRSHPSLSEIPLYEIQQLFSNDRLPNLARIDFPNCKRKDLEDEAAAGDLLAECKRRSIRVVCWEELI
ncbi:hypothetical protein RQP46_008055 [Phenoliferia psychrophenolica]